MFHQVGVERMERRGKERGKKWEKVSIRRRERPILERIIDQDVEFKEDGVLMYSVGTSSAVRRDILQC